MAALCFFAQGNAILSCDDDYCKHNGSDVGQAYPFVRHFGASRFVLPFGRRVIEIAKKGGGWQSDLKNIDGYIIPVIFMFCHRFYCNGVAKNLENSHG